MRHPAAPGRRLGTALRVIQHQQVPALCIIQQQQQAQVDCSVAPADCSLLPGGRPAPLLTLPYAIERQLESPCIATAFIKAV